jgi:archaeosine synthase beta-subunit
MLRIRSRTEQTSFPLDTAKSSEVWEANLSGQPIQRVIIYLRSSGCSWALHLGQEPTAFKPGCLDCEHSVAETTFGKPIPAASYIRQFLGEYSKYDFSKHPMLCIYNEGSFFNEAELPREARLEILRTVGSDSNVRAVILETLPAFINEDVLQETRTLLRNKHVEIGIGLESANPIIRTLCINKPFNLSQFIDACALVRKYCRVLAYALIKPSFISEAEALDDAIKTAEFAFEHGVDVVSFEPTNKGRNTMAGALGSAGLFRVPWLWTVLLAATECFELGEIRVGGYQFAPTYRDFACNCDLCTITVKQAIRRFNSTRSLSDLAGLDCPCKAEWQKELQRVHPPLFERIEQAIKTLETRY